MQHFQKRLRQYIEHCSICALNQTKRHKFYEFLLSIDRLDISFHTIVMNIVITLSSTTFENFDNFFIVINKFFKRILLLSDLVTYIEMQWVNRIITVLIQHDWNVFTVIINDKDFKFMFFFWRIVFQKLKVSLLTFTTYYSQTDDQFERINQIVKIVIKFYTFTHSNKNWIQILSYL